MVSSQKKVWFKMLLIKDLKLLYMVGVKKKYANILEIIHNGKY